MRAFLQNRLGSLELVLVAGLALGLLPGCASDEAKLAAHLKRGDAYVEEEKWDEAIIEFRNALQIAPNDGTVHYRLSQAHLRAGQAREAFWELRETVRLDDSNVDAKIQFSQLSIFAGELEEALARADEVVAADPERMEGYVVKGQAHEGLKQIEEAREAYRTATEVAPDNLSPLLLYAEFLRRNGDREAAEPQFRKGPQIENSYTAWASLGGFLRGDPDAQEEAEQALRKAIELADDDTEIVRGYSVLGAMLFQAERLDEAYALIQQGIERAENPLELIYLLARMHRSKGESERADALIEQATVARPDDPAPFLVLSTLRGRQNDLQGALEAAERALEVDPDHAAAALRRAEVLLEIGVKEGDEAPIEEARSIVAAQLEREPSLAEGLFVRAKLEVHADQLEDAIRSLRASIDLRPDWAEAHFMLGTALMLSGERAAARTELARALEIDPTLAEARQGLARVHAALGEHEYAIEEGKRYLETNPDSASVRILVAQSQLAIGESQSALETIAQVPEEQRDAQVNYALGRIHSRIGDRGSARAALEKALQSMPHQPEVLTAMLEIDGADGRIEESEERIMAAVEAVPDDARLHQLVGTLAMAKNDVKAAEAAFKKAIAVDETALGAYRQLANLFARTGRTRETIKTYEEAIAVRDEQPQLHHVLGVLYEAAGEPEKAVPHYKAAIRYAPDQGESKNNLAYIYAERGENLDEALDLAQEAKQLLPDDPNTADTLGWVLYRRGVPSAAVGFLREAEAGMEAQQQANPMSDPSTLGLIRHHLALAYKDSGDLDSAATVLERALETQDLWVADQRAQGREVNATPPWYQEVEKLRSSLP